MEYKLFDGETSYVSSFEFHADRARAPHLEQYVHTPRLHKAVEYIKFASELGSYAENFNQTFSDLGCGDGGLLQLVGERVPALTAWGYDFHPPASDGWRERGVKGSLIDVFGREKEHVKFGDITACTEVLEHLQDPHGAARWIANNTKYFIASSPWTETDKSHDECHAWAWDIDGYAELIESAGFNIIAHDKEGMFQIVLGVI